MTYKSTLRLDFKAVQEIVFEDPDLRRKLPEFKPLFDAWLLAVRAPALRQTGKRAVLDFLDLLGETHLSRIADHVGVEVASVKLDPNIVRETRTPAEDLAGSLERADGYANFAISRDATDVTVTFWR